MHPAKRKSVAITSGGVDVADGWDEEAEHAQRVAEESARRDDSRREKNQQMEKDKRVRKLKGKMSDSSLAKLQKTSANVRRVWSGSSDVPPTGS